VGWRPPGEFTTNHQPTTYSPRKEHSPMSVHDEARTRIRLSLDDAIASVTHYFGFEGVKEIEVNGEIFEVRAKVLWSPEQIKAMAELDEWVKSLDHEEVEVRNPLTNEVVLHSKTGEVLTEKVLVTPHRRNGKAVNPTFESRYLAALWGADKAARFEAAGGTYGLVNMIMAQMDDEFAQWRKNRERRDSKSD
jgi:hypothetical protein